MKTIHKKPRSTTRKVISLFGKIALLMMGEQIPKSNAANTQRKTYKKRPFYLRILIFLLKLPLLLLIAGLSTKQKEESDPITDLYMQDLSLFDPTPPCRRPPHER